MRRRDPPPRLPIGDSVADAKEVGHVPRAQVRPSLARIGLGDATEQIQVSRTRPHVRVVHRLEEPLVAAGCGHVSPSKPNRGRYKGAYPNTCSMSRVGRILGGILAPTPGPLGA